MIPLMLRWITTLATICSDGKLPDGAACDTSDECKSGVCAGFGCGPGEGTCRKMPNDRPTLSGLSCDCEGVTRPFGCDYRYAYRGPCVDGGTAP